MTKKEFIALLLDVLETDYGVVERLRKRAFENAVDGKFEDVINSKIDAELEDHKDSLKEWASETFVETANIEEAVRDGCNPDHFCFVQDLQSEVAGAEDELRELEHQFDNLETQMEELKEKMEELEESKKEEENWTPPIDLVATYLRVSWRTAPQRRVHAAYLVIEGRGWGVIFTQPNLPPPDNARYAVDLIHKKNPDFDASARRLVRSVS